MLYVLCCCCLQYIWILRLAKPGHAGQLMLAQLWSTGVRVRDMAADAKVHFQAFVLYDIYFSEAYFVFQYDHINTEKVKSYCWFCDICFIVVVGWHAADGAAPEEAQTGIVPE